MKEKGGAREKREKQDMSFQSSFRGFLLKVQYKAEKERMERERNFQSSFRGFLLKDLSPIESLNVAHVEPFNPLLEDFS